MPGQVDVLPSIGEEMFPPMFLARIGALGVAQSGIVQGRLFQLAAYMLCIALFAIFISAAGNWRNEVRSYWLNLIVIGWADLVWVLIVVLPGYMPLLRGLLPPAIYVFGVLLTTAARRHSRRRLLSVHLR